MTTEELRAAINSLPALPLGTDGWLKHRRLLRKRLAEDEPETFLDWSVIRATMQVGDSPYAMYEKGRSSFLLSQLPHDYRDMPSVIHQAYHLTRWLDLDDAQLYNLTSVVELGGGYGEMARLFRLAGCKARYQIYDFPELQLLQRYYLETHNIFDIQFPSTMPKDADLLIALWSLSEIPQPERDGLIAGLQAKHLLVGYHDFWDEVDNNVYFASWPGVRLPVAHLPGNHYLLR